MTQAALARGRRRPDLWTRLQPAIPLLVVYFALAALYAWQASQRLAPTIFTDEVELGQLSRAISETGEAARRGEPYGRATLVAYLLAPVWWLGSTATAYATAKLVLVLAMTAAVFPAFALARLVVPYWYAVGAAGAAVAVPAFAYSPVLVEEPVAYPLATLALWLIARALVRPGWKWVGAAVLASAVAALARTQLSILLVVLGLGLLWLAWQSEPVRGWRSGWSRWDWVGAVTLLVGAVVALSATIGHLSESWRNTTGYYKDRILEHASWASGALAIGIGILPVLIGIAALARPRSEPSDPRTRAFVTTSVAALAVFVWYAGIKGAFISTVHGTLIAERNLIYLYPILFAATALAFARGIGRGWAIAVSALLVLYVVTATPVELNFPYYEAHGLAILAFANRELGWHGGLIADTLVLLCFVAAALAIALHLVRHGSRAFHAIAACSAVAVLAWSLTTEVYAARGERTLSDQVERNHPKPYDWVDQATGGNAVVVIGQRFSDPTGVHLTEFFNRSIRKVWSLDGTAPGPGPILTPDLAAPDGSLTPPPGVRYALALNGVELQAPVAASRGNDTLYRLDDEVLKLRHAVVGVETDGWMIGSNDDPVARASYTRYDVSRDGPGFAVVKLSRVEWCPQPKTLGEGMATIRIGPVAIGEDKQPAIADVLTTREAVVKNCEITPFVLPTPSVPWRIEITIEPTFVPHEIDPSSSDRRQLGAVVGVDFQALFDS